MQQNAYSASEPTALSQSKLAQSGPWAEHPCAQWKQGAVMSSLSGQPSISGFPPAVTMPQQSWPQMQSVGQNCPARQSKQLNPVSVAPFLQSPAQNGSDVPDGAGAQVACM